MREQMTFQENLRRKLSNKIIEFVSRVSRVYCVKLIKWKLAQLRKEIQ